MGAGTRIYGIAASESRDKSQELLRVKGADTSNLRWFNDEHSEPTSMNLGFITGHKKIFAEQDCENPKQLRCWKLARVPFIYVEGELFDAEDHPFAQAAGAIIKFAAQNPEYRVPIGLSIEGGIVERLNEQGQPDKDGKILNHTIATKATITVKPCNPQCAVFMENDLMKSLAAVPPPANLEKIMTAPESAQSFRDDRMVRAFFLLDHLRKSLEDYRSGFTSMKCLKCNMPHRFFKDSKEIPNHCGGCNMTFTLRDIWGALNR